MNLEETRKKASGWEGVGGKKEGSSPVIVVDVLLACLPARFLVS